MAEGKSRKATRLAGYDYNTPGVYFLTLCTKERRCLLSRIVGAGVLDGPKIELLPYGEAVAKYIGQIGGFYEDLSVERYVIMPNHIHLLLTVKGPSGTPAPTLQNSTVSRFVSTMKRFCNKECGENIWQRGFFDHIIRDQEDFDAHLKYIEENSFGWQKDDLYSVE